MHISEKIAELLIEDGFEFKNGGEYAKRVNGFAEAGQLSNGARVVRLTISENGRWLSRVDGWGKVEKDVDLREYYNYGLNGCKAAIYSVMR